MYVAGNTGFHGRARHGWWGMSAYIIGVVGWDYCHVHFG